MTRKVALIAFSSPARVHPLVAMRWAQRRPTIIALAANAGYLPGRVSFSMRTRTGIDLIGLLEGLHLTHGGEMAHGHDAATGGSLPSADFARLLAAESAKWKELLKSDVR